MAISSGPSGEGAVEPIRTSCERVESQRTPLGICRSCTLIVYADDTLAMAGGYLLHGHCCAVAEAPRTTESGR